MKVLVSPIAITRIEDMTYVMKKIIRRKKNSEQRNCILDDRLTKGVVMVELQQPPYALSSVVYAQQDWTTNDYAEHGLLVSPRNWLPERGWFWWCSIRFKSADVRRQEQQHQFRLVYAEDIWRSKYWINSEFFIQPEGIILTRFAQIRRKSARVCPTKTTEIFNSKYPIGLCDKHTSADWNQGKEAKNTKEK